MNNTQIKKVSEVGTYANIETALKVEKMNNDFFKKTNQTNLFAITEKENCKVIVYRK